MVATAAAWVLCREILGGAFARRSVSSCGEAWRTLSFSRGGGERAVVGLGDDIKGDPGEVAQGGSSAPG